MHVLNYWSFVTALLALWSVAIPTVGFCQQPSNQAFRVVGYLPDYRLSEIDEGAMARLTDLILFSAEIRPDGALDLGRLRSTPWERIAQLKAKHRVRLILCVGGWERSDGFPKVASDKVLLANFVRSAVAICAEQRLDGIDLDWEHPKDEKEQQGYANMLLELRTAFQPRGLSLSITMAAWQSVPKEAFDAVDWIQVMAYDHQGKHSTMEGAKADIDRLRAAGASDSKLTLGLPFYGRKLGAPDQVKTYREISKSNVSADVDEWEGYYFNGPRTIRDKVSYARKAGLAGVMVWELGQDAKGDGSLLKEIQKALGDQGIVPK